MPTTSKVIIKTVVKGSNEGVSLQGEFTQVNTTGTRVSVETTFAAGIGSATTFSSPPNARWVTISMPSDNTEPWRLSATTAEVGIAMSSHGASVLSIPPTTSGSTWFAYTTGTTAISGVRIVFSQEAVIPAHPDARKKIMNHLFRGDALGAHSTYWLALHNTTLSTATLPSTVTEVSTVGTGYARMPLTSAIFSSATTSLSTVHLTTRVQFPDPLVNWTTVKGFSIHDSSVRSSGGAGSTCWFFGDVNTSVNVSAGNPVAISSGTSTNGLQIGLA